MDNQQTLRTQVKLVKAQYDDIFYKDFASFLGMNENSFYNWLNGYYKLSSEKVRKLRDVLVDLLD